MTLDLISSIHDAEPKYRASKSKVGSIDFPVNEGL